MPSAASGTHMANSNGKRPHGALQNGAEEDEAVETLPNAGRSSLPVQTHASSGYRWSRPEDEPGYAWLNKKAYDEMTRAMDSLAHKDIAVKGELSHDRSSPISSQTDNHSHAGRYGDPLELAEREAALLASLK
jgi:hypothetical protein